jgi:hypothetical protein
MLCCIVGMQPSLTATSLQATVVNVSWASRSPGKDAMRWLWNLSTTSTASWGTA